MHVNALTRTFAVALATSAVTSAQQLMVVDNTNDTILLVSAVDGSLLNSNFIDLRLGTGSAPGTIIQAQDNGNGEIWITDQTADTVHRWSSDGTTYLGQWGTGRDNIRGIHIDFNRVWLCNFGTGGAGYGFALKEYQLNTTFVTAHPFPGSPFGVVSFGNELLVSDTTNDDIVRVDPATGAVLGVFHDSDGVSGVDFPGQLSWSPQGTLLTASLVTPAGIFEYDTTGTQINYFDSTGIGTTPQGVYGLQNGNILLGAGNGLFVYDRVAGTFTAIVAGIDANYITPLGGGIISTNYCTANNNSTGSPASMSASGSLSVAANNLTLQASGLPNNSFGFFLTALNRGFIANPGGSQGNLCLSGNIGRYVGPGQIKNSGATGQISLTVNLAQHPTPSGPVQVMPGETWRFTAWYRDANPAATSNFADGIEFVFMN